MCLWLSMSKNKHRYPYPYIFESTKYYTVPVIGAVSGKIIGNTYAYSSKVFG